MPTKPISYAKAKDIMGEVGAERLLQIFLAMHGDEIKPSQSAFQIVADSAGISASSCATGYGRLIKKLRQGGAEIDDEDETTTPAVAPKAGGRKRKNGDQGSTKKVARSKKVEQPDGAQLEEQAHKEMDSI